MIELWALEVYTAIDIHRYLRMLGIGMSTTLNDRKICAKLILQK